MGWALDLDGVVWLARQPLPGAADAVAQLRAAGQQVLFVTNNAQFGPATVAERLCGVGVPADPAEVVTSAMAAATLVEPGERVLPFAGPGVREALDAAGAEVVRLEDHEPTEVDTVVVGRHTDLRFDALTAAIRAVACGARLAATNADPAYPTPRGPEPGAGSLLAAVETASGRQADVVAGKPHQPMASLVAERLGPVGWVVGDSPATDGLLATALGYRFGLVLSGVTDPADLPVAPVPDVVAADLGDLVALVLGGQGR